MHSNFFKGLSDPQKGFIKTSIEHFFIDLPKEEKELAKKAKEFQQAFAHELPADHELYNFQNCIYYPTLFLRLLDLEGNQFTARQVGRYILNYTQRKLNAAAKKSQIPFASLQWDAKNTIAKINSLLNDAKPFSSERLAVSGDDFNFRPIADLKPPPGVIYEFQLVPGPRRLKSDEQENPFEVKAHYFHLTVKTHLEIESKKPHSVTIEADNFHLIPTSIRTDAQQDQFMKEIEPKVLAKADELARKEAVKYLILEKENLSNAAKTILTYRFYYEGIKYFKLSCGDFTKIQAEHVKILTHPDIILLVKEGIAMAQILQLYNPVTAERNASLSEEQKISPYKRRNVVTTPFFLTKILRGEMSIKYFVKLTDEECNNLILSNVHHLLAAKLITLKQAKEISRASRLIVQDPFYFELLFKGFLSLAMFQHLTLPQANMLLNAKIKNLIKLNIQNKNTIEQILRLTPSQCKLIIKYDYLQDMLSHHVIYVEDINEKSCQFWAKILNARLAAIFNGNPYLLGEDVDSCEKIKNDMRQFVQQYLLSNTELTKNVTALFIQEVMPIIMKQLQNASFLQNIKNELLQTEPDNFFNKFISMTKQYLLNPNNFDQHKKMKTSLKLFSEKRSDGHSGDIAICETIEKLDFLNISVNLANTNFRKRKTF